MELKFTVHGEPKGKGRPRFNTKTGHAITPKDTVIYENLVRMEYLNQCGETKFPDDAMLDMRIKAYYTIPPSRPKKKKELMRAGIIRPTKKPDMDNCIMYKLLNVTNNAGGSTYYKVPIESVTTTSDGMLEIAFKIELSSGSGEVSEVQLYDTDNQLWLSKAERLKMDSVAEGFSYIVQLEISEVLKTS